MVGRTTSALYTLNTMTGAATRVGNSNQFGVGQTRPAGLASHSNGNLYMVGAVPNRLYALNTSTGAATAIGPERFGVNEDGPIGLVVHKGRMYLAGDDDDDDGSRWYELDPATGEPVGSIGSSDNATDDIISSLRSATSHPFFKAEVIDRGISTLYRNHHSDLIRSGWFAIGLPSGNNSAAGISIINNRVYILDSFDKQIYTTRSLSLSGNDSFRRLPLSASSIDPRGISVISDFSIYVIDSDGTLYTVPPTGFSSLTADSWTTVPVHSNISNTGGLKVTDDYIYILNVTDNRIYKSTSLNPTSDNDWEIIELPSDITSPQGISIYDNDIYIVDNDADKLFKSSLPTTIVTPAILGTEATPGTPATQGTPSTPGTPGVPAVDPSYNGLYKVASNTLTLESFLDAANSRPIGIGSDNNVVVILNAPASGQTNTNLYLYDVPGDTNLRIGISTRSNQPPGRTDFLNFTFSQGGAEIFSQAVSNSSPTSSTNNNERFYDIPMTQALISANYSLGVEFNEALPDSWRASNLNHSFIYENENYKILALEAFESGTKIHLNVSFKSVPNKILGFHIRLSGIGSSDASTFVDTSNVGNVFYICKH